MSCGCDLSEEEDDDDPCPMKVVDNLYPLVLEALTHINGGNGAKVKQIFCYIRKHCGVDLEDGELNCAIRGALKKGLCKRAIKRSLLGRLMGKYKLRYRCAKGKCTPSEVEKMGGDDGGIKKGGKKTRKVDEKEKHCTHWQKKASSSGCQAKTKKPTGGHKCPNPKCRRKK